MLIFLLVETIKTWTFMKIYIEYKRRCTQMLEGVESCCCHNKYLTMIQMQRVTLWK